ncbi:putative cell wall-binding protein [Catenulispora sp. EB89]|uniref:cell wall-binding repeat-containing protein n=1 Tax=Catenulispora sp. EB89 TaxID=3156257 RepID=UPI00351888CA
MVDRVGGQDHVDTAVDALAGSALAGEKRGPLLLTPRDSRDTRDLAELHRTLPRGATVYLLGGTDALSANVQNQVTAAGFVPKRLQGATAT